MAILRDNDTYEFERKPVLPRKRRLDQIFEQSNIEQMSRFAKSLTDQNQYYEQVAQLNQ